ncbi:hypothetical protein N0V90_000356 [Kalmusia sp. IMI 367209]|nr:hypothetical protein N0V90_000356 [Kalmusia sp. IMI 367209]
MTNPLKRKLPASINGSDRSKRMRHEVLDQHHNNFAAIRPQRQFRQQNFQLYPQEQYFATPMSTQHMPQSYFDFSRQRVQQNFVTVRKPDPRVPYNDRAVPILLSAKIDHSTSPVDFQTKDWKSRAWNNYRHAIKLLKTGISREQFSLPEAKDSCGPILTIDCVDLYVYNTHVYVAATEQGLLTVPEYLKLCGIPLERKIRFNGKIPMWARTLFEMADRRTVWECAAPDQCDGQIDLEEMSTVSVYHTDTTFPDYDPYCSWGYVYCDRDNQIGWFPLNLTRPFGNAGERGEKLPKGLSEVEKAHVFCLPPRKPNPQELAEAKFRRAEERERGEGQNKTLNDYLKECGYLYGKYAPENQKKTGIFFDEPTEVPAWYGEPRNQSGEPPATSAKTSAKTSANPTTNKTLCTTVAQIPSEGSADRSVDSSKKRAAVVGIATKDTVEKTNAEGPASDTHRDGHKERHDAETDLTTAQIKYKESHHTKTGDASPKDAGGGHVQTHDDSGFDLSVDQKSSRDANGRLLVEVSPSKHACYDDIDTHDDSGIDLAVDQNKPEKI